MADMAGERRSINGSPRWRRAGLQAFDVTHKVFFVALRDLRDLRETSCRRIVVSWLRQFQKPAQRT
jgi:hypothetical protein